METSLPLATDSFSHSWLSNFKPPVNGLEEVKASIHSITSSEGLMAEPQNFNFDVSITQSPAVHAHADELFSDGFIRPLSVDPSMEESCNTPNSTQATLSSVFYSGIVSPRTVEIHHGFHTKSRKSAWQVLRSSFRFLKQLCQRAGGSRKSTRVGDFGKTEWEVKSGSISVQASPKSVIGDLCDHENPIYEAVLHCKRSIGILMLFFSFSFWHAVS